MRDTWPNARVRKNASLIRTFHGFKGTLQYFATCNAAAHWAWPIILYYVMLSGNKQGALEFFKLVFRALCLCWDRQTQDLHIDWILFRGRSLVPVSCEVVSDNIDGQYPSSHYPIFAEFLLPRAVRIVDPPAQEENWYASVHLFLTTTYLIFSSEHWRFFFIVMGFRFILSTICLPPSCCTEIFNASLRCIKRGCGSPFECLVYVMWLCPRILIIGDWFFFFSCNLETQP